MAHFKITNHIISLLAAVPPLEKPDNGLKGLKYWKQDSLAGLSMALILDPSKARWNVY